MIKIGDIELEYIDYVTIISKDNKIAFSSRFEMGKNKESHDISVIGRNFFEIYPEYDFSHSALQRSLNRGEICSSLNDTYKDYKGKIHCTDGISFPIMEGGKIIGAIELSRDRTTVKNIKNKNTSDIISHGSDKEEMTYEEDGFNYIFTKNSKMHSIIEKAKLISSSTSPTLIYGETGTGKELFVQAMIQNAGYPLDKVVTHNCASIPENLAESILFGSEKGAYTGAEKKNGLFWEANHGVFFLDELNSLPYNVQGKLLRVLQDGKFRPVGSNKEISVDVKIIATMNVDPMLAISRNELRADLFYRLSSNMISIPPLRDRIDDIIPTAYHFIEEYNKKFNKNVISLSKVLEDFFILYPWNGNVRELKNTIESMIFSSNTNTLTEDELPGYMFDKFMSSKLYEKSTNTNTNNIENDKPILEDLNLKSILEKTELEIIKEALKRNNFNISKAAISLGLPRQTLQYKIEKFNLK